MFSQGYIAVVHLGQGDHTCDVVPSVHLIRATGYQSFLLPMMLTLISRVHDL